MTHNDRELALCAKIEKLEAEKMVLKLEKQHDWEGIDLHYREKIKKLERALEIAKDLLWMSMKMNEDEDDGTLSKRHAIKCKEALEKIEKELGE